MRTVLCILAGVFLMGSLTAGPVEKATSPATGSPTKAAPGVEAAQAVSTLTGVAISPLLGVGAVGAWTYYRAEAAQRPRLPWFAQPWFWIPALALVALVFFKDVAGTTLPTTLKKPFDILELFENKVSALVVAGAFVPLIATIFPAIQETSHFADQGLAFIDPAGVLNLLLLPLAITAFLVVFLAGHAINVMILVSPFGMVDAALKTFRVFLMSTVLATSLANPYFGALWALILIVGAYFIAGWTFRVSVFGTVFAWDLVSFKHKRFRPQTGAPLVFTARSVEKTPVRTCGRLMRDEQGRLIVQYRPWLILPWRTLVLPEGEYFVGRGLLHPEIHRAEGQSSEALIALPPRFRSHEAEAASVFGLGAVRDIGLRRGFTALWAWLKGTFGRRPQVAPAAAA